ncbi:hypothetical protein Ddc_06670 [Ditylenchus destructor]|nr:hypothetical protein Ddc_06670 [Ditylenchus destructor]
MDFDPDHPKWLCCCCSISSGLKILCSAETVIALIFLFTGVTNLINNMGSQEEDIPLYLSLSIVSLFVATTSLLLVAGIHKRRIQWMYPSLAARVLVIIFVTVFGVSYIVQPDKESEIPTKPRPKLAGTIKTRPGQPEPSTAIRFVFLMFIMVFLCIGIFYTIYLVVRAIRFVKCFRRLEDRRCSLIAAGLIEPELMASNRRNSKASLRNM